MSFWMHGLREYNRPIEANKNSTSFYDKRQEHTKHGKYNPAVNVETGVGFIK